MGGNAAQVPVTTIAIYNPYYFTNETELCVSQGPEETFFVALPS